MELITILNHCYHHRGFVYQHARFGADNKSIEVDVRPREGSAAVCSGCHRPAPGYDRLPERGFEFIPLWGFLVFLLYRMRRVDSGIVASWSRRFAGAMANTRHAVERLPSERREKQESLIPIRVIKTNKVHKHDKLSSLLIAL